MKWFSIAVVSTFLFMAIPAIYGENQASNQDVSLPNIEHTEANDEKFNLEDIPELKEMDKMKSEEISDEQEFDTQEIERDIDMLMADSQKADKEIESINKLLENQEKEVAANKESIDKEISMDNLDEQNLPPEQVVKDTNVSDKSEINSEKEQDTETPEEK